MLNQFSVNCARVKTALFFLLSPFLFFHLPTGSFFFNRPQSTFSLLMTSGIELNKVIGRDVSKMEKEQSLIAEVSELCSRHSFPRPFHEFGLRGKV